MKKQEIQDGLEDVGFFKELQEMLEIAEGKGNISKWNECASNLTKITISYIASLLEQKQ